MNRLNLYLNHGCLGYHENLKVVELSWQSLISSPRWRIYPQKFVFIYVFSFSRGRMAPTVTLKLLLVHIVGDFYGFFLPWDSSPLIWPFGPHIFAKRRKSKNSFRIFGIFTPKLGKKYLPGTPSVLFLKATLPLKPATIALRTGYLASR